MRPRDIIAFFNECIRAAEGKARIGFKDLRSAEAEYSRARSQSGADEWFSDYPNINMMARAFLGGTASLQHAGSLLAQDRLTVTQRLRHWRDGSTHHLTNSPTVVMVLCSTSFDPGSATSHDHPHPSPGSHFGTGVGSSSMAASSAPSALLAR